MFNESSTAAANVFFADRQILLDAVTRSTSTSDLVVLDRQFTYAPIALAMERGDPDFRLAVDRALSQLYGSKDFSSLYATWFGSLARALIRSSN